MPNARGIFERLFVTERSTCLPRRYHPAYLLVLVLLLMPRAALAQSNAEWTEYKIKCGIPASTAYNDWVAQGSPCPKSAAAANSTAPAVPALTPQQQLGMQAAVLGGTMIGQGLHQLLFPSKPALAPPDPAEQRRELAAEQLNNSGLYLLRQKNYRGAINEFQKALAIIPNDSNTLHNLALARQKLQDSAVAGQTSGTLSQFLGNAPANTGNFDLDQLRHSSFENPHATALGLVDLSSDSRVVDLRDAGKTSVDPELLKTQLDRVLTNGTPAPPRSQVVLPQDKDMELLSILSQPGVSHSQPVLPQDKDMELLSTLPPSGTSQSQIVLPQDKDMELLGFPPPSASEAQKKVKPATINTGGKSSSTPQGQPAPSAPPTTPPNPTPNN